MERLVRNSRGILFLILLSGFLRKIPGNTEARATRKLFQTATNPIPHSYNEGDSKKPPLPSPDSKQGHAKRTDTTPQLDDEESAVKKSRTAGGPDNPSNPARATNPTRYKHKRDAENWGEDQINADNIPRPIETTKFYEIKTNGQRRSAAESTVDILSEKTNPPNSDARSERRAILVRVPDERSAKFLENRVGFEADDLEPGSKWFKRSVNGQKVKNPALGKISLNEASLIKRDKKGDISDKNDKENKSQEDEVKDSQYRDGEMAYLGLGSDDKVLKHLLDQGDGSMKFGTDQEASEEKNLIKEIETMAQESSKLPKGLHLPYTNGPLDNTGMDFANMDISVGKESSDDAESSYVGDKGESDPSYLKRTSISRRSTSESDKKIPRQFVTMPRLERFPKFERFPPIEPSQLDEFHRLPRYPAIPQLLLDREPVPFRAPVPHDEAVPLDEPPPIPMNEPPPIPNLQGIRDIAPIPEPREPAPENLNPKETFGDKKSNTKLH